MQGLFVGVILLLCGCAGEKAELETIILSNDLISLQVAPEIGGRVLQFQFGDHNFFWANEDLMSTKPPPTSLDPEGGWLNYGGDKLWPAPQGWDNDQQWPGPPDPVLDGGQYQAQLLGSQINPKAIKLTSDKGSRAGIQFSRTIRIFEDTTRVAIEATMTNVDDKPRRWGIWGHTQLDAGIAGSSQYNDKLQAWCPVNPDSHFPKGYDIIFGTDDNPSFTIDPQTGFMHVRYYYLVGKIGMDSDAGWVATVDGRTGDVFVHRFIYEPDKEYPDGSSVEFWHNGKGSIYAYNKNMEMPDNPKENPYVFESEILSPFANLEPGQSYTWNYEWFATQVGGEFGILDCTALGVTCQPLRANKTDNEILLEGRFGVFYQGSLAVHYLDASGKQIHKEILVPNVSPLKACVLSHAVRAIQNTAFLSVHLYDKSGRDLGQLSITSL